MKQINNANLLPMKYHPMGFKMPVALRKQGTGLARGANDNPVAETDEKGRIVYALPGGGRWVEK